MYPCRAHCTVAPECICTTMWHRIAFLYCMLLILFFISSRVYFTGSNRKHLKLAILWDLKLMAANKLFVTNMVNYACLKALSWLELDLSCWGVAEDMVCFASTDNVHVACTVRCKCARTTWVRFDGLVLCLAHLSQYSLRVNIFNFPVCMNRGLIFSCRWVCDTSIIACAPDR